MSDFTQPNIPEESFTHRYRQRPPGAGRKLYTLRSIVVGTLAGLTTFILLAGLIAVGAYVYLQVYGLIVPGVRMGSLQLGGMNTEQAAATLDSAWNSQLEIAIAAGDREWQAPLSDFGIQLNAEATAQQAANVGHGGSIPVEMADTVDALVNGWPIQPVVTLDEETARAGLTRWAETINLPPQDATLRFENGTVVAAPGQTGYQLDVESTLMVLSAAPSFPLEQGYLPMVLVPIAPRISDASAALTEAQRLLSKPLAVTVYDAITDESSQFSAGPEQIAGWLAVQNGDDVRVVVDETKVAGYLQEIGATLGEGRYLDPARNAGVIQQALETGQPAFLVASHPATTYTVRAGDMLTSIAWDVGIPYWRILDANPGLDANQLNAGETLTIPSKDDLLPLPIIPGKRIVLSISEQHLWAYQDGQELYSFVISTGIDRSPTQPGVFQVQTHELEAYASLWDLYMPHFMGIYQSWPGFWNGFHGLPLLHGGVRLWGDILGKPASFGCIILSLEDAEALYNWAEDGVVVEIRE